LQSTIWDAWWDGNSWQLQQLNGGGWQRIVPSMQTVFAQRFFVSPYDPNLIYIVDQANIKRSDDGGHSWQIDVSLENQLTNGGAISFNPASVDFIEALLTDMQFDPVDPLRRFAVGMGGAFFTTDGVTWDRLLDTSA
jgi:hypothetical protein